MVNSAFQKLNEELKENINLLEREENILRRRKTLLGKISDEEKTVDEIKRYT